MELTSIQIDVQSQQKINFINVVKKSTKIILN